MVYVFQLCQYYVLCVPSVGFFQMRFGAGALFFQDLFFKAARLLLLLLPFLLSIPSLFWQQEAPNDNSRRHKGDLRPKITHRKSFSLFCRYLSSCLLTLCLPLCTCLSLSTCLCFFHSLSLSLYLSRGGFSLSLLALFLSNVLFHIHTVAHFHGVSCFWRAQSFF